MRLVWAERDHETVTNIRRLVFFLCCCGFSKHLFKKVKTLDMRHVSAWPQSYSGDTVTVTASLSLPPYTRFLIFAILFIRQTRRTTDKVIDEFDSFELSSFSPLSFASGTCYMSRIKQLGVFHRGEFGLCGQWPEKPKHQITAMSGDAECGSLSLKWLPRESGSWPSMSWSWRKRSVAHWWINFLWCYSFFVTRFFPHILNV